MGPWMVRELEEWPDVLDAASEARLWGFPRPIDLTELEGGVWFRMGRGVVWWYEPPNPRTPGYAWLHLAVAPRLRGRWPVRRWQSAAEVCAELMGASALVFVPVAGDDEIVRYALRAGWTRQESGHFVLNLGGGSRWASCRRPASSVCH